MLRWGSLVALTGCAQLAGIDSTSKGVDAAPTIATLQMERVQIGKTIARGPQDLTGVTANFLVPDDAAPGGFRRVPATLSGLDTWQADVGGTPVPILFESPELPTPVTRMYDFPNLHVKAPLPVLEHPVAEPAPAGATITVNVALNTAHNNESYQLFTIGAWSNVGLAAPIAGATQLQPGPVTLIANNSPIRRLDKLTVNDVVMILRYDGNQLVAHLDVPPFEQMANNTITGALVATQLNQTLNLSVNQMQIAQRFSTVRPAVGGPSYVWRLRAAPGLDFNIDNGPLLHAASVAAPIAADPQSITATYGNPFSALFRTVVQWESTANRTYTNPTSMQTATLSARFTQRAEPTAGLALTHPAGLPDRITANGTVLTIDNATVSAGPNTPVEVSFITDAATNTMHMVQLIELVPNMTTYNLTSVVVVHTPTPRARLPRDLFKDGSLYVIRAFSLQGCFTAVASGDLTQVALPCSTAFADSGVFQVVSP